ncbi:hypothetical protein GQ607_000195 [Colletotrichum asianum]|uniref:Uncharacterized protein n=1 Tax=Colletotrichum asianum TaxID=702518 RepID=A0A8H3WS81_9PEZI|nr:hypothetical protein GQ607_000195 [Colletotrichum asianum]
MYLADFATPSRFSLLLHWPFCPFAGPASLDSGAQMSKHNETCVITLDGLLLRTRSSPRRTAPRGSPVLQSLSNSVPDGVDVYPGSCPSPRCRPRYHLSETIPRDTDVGNTLPSVISSLTKQSPCVTKRPLLSRALSTVASGKSTPPRM